MKNYSVDELKKKMFYYKQIYYEICAKEKGNYFSLDYILKKINESNYSWQ
jgi:hypothetical protein